MRAADWRRSLSSTSSVWVSSPNFHGYGSRPSVAVLAPKICFARPSDCRARCPVSLLMRGRRHVKKRSAKMVNRLPLTKDAIATSNVIVRPKAYSDEAVVRLHDQITKGLRKSTLQSSSPNTHCFAIYSTISSASGSWMFNPALVGPRYRR